ncbi:hypothetical protein ACEQ8H_008133 [Pleosporales sp. CAS-2024a]
MSSFPEKTARRLLAPRLPACWPASQNTNNIRDPAADATSSATAVSGGRLFLDFLYPERTLALLKQLSVPPSDALSPQRRRLHAPPVRHYATTPPEPTEPDRSLDEDNDQVDGLVVEDKQALHKLREFLAHQEPRGQDKAWQLYRSIPASTLAQNGHWRLRADLLEYLAVDDAPVPNRALQLFKEIPEDHRRTSSYRAAVAAYISLRMVGPALRLLDGVPPYRELDFSSIGVDIILRRTVSDQQWNLSLHVFKLFLDHNPTLGKEVPVRTAIYWANALPGIWKKVSTLHSLNGHLQSFLEHVEEYQHDFNTEDKKETLSLFTMTFVPHVMEHVLQDLTISGHKAVKFFNGLFKKLSALNMPLAVFYEHALRRLMKVDRERDSFDIDALRASLFRRYRELCLSTMGQSDSKRRVKPSIHLLRNMIVYHGDLNQLERARAVIKDYRVFYPEEPFRPGLLKYLVHCFANSGLLAEAELYLSELQKSCNHDVDIKLLSALPFACARRADIGGTIAQFKRIRDEFGFVQDTACWNTLLLAYVRADDLDGALDCFNIMLANDVIPDLVSYGTLLDLCAKRGDVESFESLFTKAEQSGIDLTHDVRARSGYVQVFLNAGDAEAADAIAQGMLRNWKAGALTGYALTHTWNILIQHHALNRDITGARERYREMVDNGIPLDSWTYGSLMRALVEVKQTNAAYRILTKTMPMKSIHAYGLHYAIVMTGFLREGGGQLDRAIEVYKRMKEQGITQTFSSQEATVRTMGAQELRNLEGLRPRHANYQLKDVNKAVDEMLVDAVQGQAISRQPIHTRQRDMLNDLSAPQALYGLLISLYAQRDAYKTCMRLFRRAERLAANETNYTAPIGLAAATMEELLKAGEHAGLARLWEVALTSARKLTKTFSQLATPEPADTASMSLLDPSVRERFSQSRIAPNRRNILYKASRLYIRSLLDPKNPREDALQEAQHTVRDLLVEGYHVGVFTWNELVRALAERGHLEEAFAMCEIYLMPGFPGWRELDNPMYVRKERQGYRWMELRHYEITPDRIMPKYQTLIVLAAAFRKVRADERNGVGYNEAAGAWQRQLLEEAAPLTLRAIQTMPRTDDLLQKKYFQDEM